MASLPAHAVHAVPDFSIQNDARAHACAQGQHAHGIAGHFLAGAALPFGQRSRVGIALHNHRRLQIRLHRILQQEAIEAGQVGGTVKSTRGQFERAGSSNTDANQLLIGPAPLEHAADSVAHVAHHGFGAFAHAGW